MENTDHPNCNRLLNYKEAAEALRVHEQTIMRLCKQRKLAITCIGGKRFIREDEIENYIIRQTVPAKKTANSRA